MRTLAWCAVLVALRTAGGTSFDFTTLEFSLGTEAFGINNRGDIVGVTFGTLDAIPFVYSNGVLQPLPVPGIPSGVNDAGQVVGSFEIGALQHAFLYSGGAVTQIDYPGAFQSEALAINSAGVVYGEWEGTAGQGHGYLYQNGVFTDLSLPDHSYWSSQRGGINDAGVIATTLLGIPGSPGVVWDHGTLAQVNYPGADFSYVYGINNRGDLVGIYGAGGFYSWAYIDGEFSPVIFSPPGSGDKVNAINDADQIVGTYPNQFGRLYTFVGEPVPEAASGIMFAGGAVLLCGFRVSAGARRRRMLRTAGVQCLMLATWTMRSLETCRRLNHGSDSRMSQPMMFVAACLRL